MTDHVDVGGHDDAGRPGDPASRGGRPLATALAGMVVLAVAGGWAYDHRAEYGIAYAQLFEEAADACRFGEPACTAAAADEGPGCCHADGTCSPAADLAALSPVEAPKPPAAL